MQGSEIKERLDCTEADGNRRPVFLLLLIYTGLFAVLAAAVYFFFISEGRTFLRFGFTNKDSFSQRYMFLFEFRRFVEGLFSGGTLNTWDWSIGLGSDGYSFNISNLVNPFMYIAAFAPVAYADVVYTLTIVARVWLSGITFILFARKTGLNDFQNILGAVMYVFSPWIITNSIAQGTFIMATVMLPLVLLGVEKVIRKESPLPLVFSVAYSVAVTFTFAYMIAILTIMYFLVRYLTAYRGDGIKAFGGRFLALLGWGSCGILVSGAALVVTVMKLGNTTTVTGKEVPLLFTMTEYLRMPLKLIDYSTVFETSSVIGATMLAAALIPAVIYCAIKLRTNAVMTVLLYALMLLPYTSSVFNFFSYISGRWMFALSFFLALAAAEAFDRRYLGNKWVRAFMAAFVIVYAGYLMWIQKVLKQTGKLVVIVNFAALLIITVIILFAFRDKGRKFSENAVFRKAVCLAVSLVMALGFTTAYNLRIFKTGEGFLAARAADAMISYSAQRVGRSIDDDDFYRVDQVGDLIGTVDPHCKVNEAMYFGNRSNYVFCSYVDNDWLTYNKLLGNNQGYYKRVAPNSNDDRFGLDFLQGVKYFIGDNVPEDVDDRDTTPYAAFGFDEENEKEVDGVELTENRYSIGLGCVFTEYMRMSEWLKLSYAEREIAMMRAAVIDDAQRAPSGMKELKASSLKSGVEEIDYEETARNSKGDKLTISAENDGRHQIILSFKNIRTNKNGRLTVRVNNGTVRKSAVNTIKDVRGFPDIKDLTFNLGSGKNASETIKIHMFPNGEDKKTAKVKYDDIVMYRIPLDEYEKAAEKLEENRLELTRFDNDILEGNVSCARAGMLYLSVPDDDGWEIRVDGKKVKKRTGVDVAFTGIDLQPGDHTVVLEYHTRGMLAGMLLSLAGLIVTVIALVISRKKAPETANNSDLSFTDVDV